MPAPAVALSGVTRVYPGGVRALDGVDLRVECGEWVAIMGPSGSGKTTLLNLLDGLDRASSGVVRVLGTDLGAMDPDAAATFRREHIGLVFQQFHLLPYLTALENVMLAQHYHSLADEAEALEALDRVDMATRAHHRPGQLSGGEQQRVCVARALTNEPELVLADEPTGNLDEDSEARVLELLDRLHGQGRTLIMVTHDRAVGERADRIIRLDHGRLVTP